MLHFGGVSLRRVAVLERLQQHGFGASVVVETYGDEALAPYLRTAKVVLAPALYPGEWA